MTMCKEVRGNGQIAHCFMDWKRGGGPSREQLQQQPRQQAERIATLEKRLDDATEFPMEEQQRFAATATYFAVATDSNALTSVAASTTVTTQNIPPTIGSLTASPNPGDYADLTASKAGKSITVGFQSSRHRAPCLVCRARRHTACADYNLSKLSMSAHLVRAGGPFGSYGPATGPTLHSRGRRSVLAQHPLRLAEVVDLDNGQDAPPNPAT